MKADIDQVIRFYQKYGNGLYDSSAVEYLNDYKAQTARIADLELVNEKLNELRDEQVDKKLAAYQKLWRLERQNTKLINLFKPTYEYLSMLRGATHEDKERIDQVKIELIKMAKDHEIKT